MEYWHALEYLDYIIRNKPLQKSLGGAIFWGHHTSEPLAYAVEVGVETSPLVYINMDLGCKSS